MDYKAVTTNIMLFVIFGFIGFYYLLFNYTFYFRFDFQTPTLLVILGIFLGTCSFGLVSLRELRIIHKRGEYKLSRIYQIIGLSLIAIALGILLWISLFIFSYQFLLLSLYFLYPYVLAGFTTRAIMFKHWEIRNRSILFVNSVGTKLYAKLKN